MGRDTLIPRVHYHGKPIGYPGWGKPHEDYICSFFELGAIMSDPAATEEQKKAAREEFDIGMDDFS